MSENLAPAHWAAFKLLLDPALEKCDQKVFRYDGRGKPIKYLLLRQLAPFLSHQTGWCKWTGCPGGVARDRSKARPFR